MKQNILVIEENAAVRYLLTTVLNKRFKVAAYSNCFDASCELKDASIELIIINIDPSNNENIDFLKHVHTSSLYTDIPVIALLKKENDELKAVCANLEVDEFFVKPFDPMVLLNSVSNLVSETGNIYRNIEKFGQKETEHLRLKLSN
ncbi:MAG: response regulator [Terrimonas sp.]|nr:response regulator [Terrimonas sp.]